MSRIGKMPVPVPEGVSVDINAGEVTVKGPKGELRRQFNPDMMIEFKEDILTVSRPSDDRVHRSLHGLTRTLLANMVEGVTEGCQRTLDIVGVGYRAEKSGDNLIINVGFSHPVEVKPLPGITLEVVGNRINVSGIDKEVVGEMTARIRAIRPPDAYKGKGIRYSEEIVRLKPGKAGKAIGRG
ncbi:MAG: 50S ribosomal protein L6 [Dehalococcoidales bacterium]|nr:MAG: 50S ribosomal protein L6 [Dehalococcoidales bacterium]